MAYFETLKITGNAGGIFDGATGAAVPANVLYIGGNKSGNLAGLTIDSNGYLNETLPLVTGPVAAGTAAANSLLAGLVCQNASTPPNPSGGQQLALQGDIAANLKVSPGIALIANAFDWSSGTSSGTTYSLVYNSGVPAILVQLNQGTGITGGAVTWEGTFDGTHWVSVPAGQVLDPTSSTFAQIANPYTLQASTNKPFLLLLGGFQQLRIKLSTVISGASNTDVFGQLTYLPYSPVEPVTGTVAQGAAAASTAPWYTRPGAPTTGAWSKSFGTTSSSGDVTLISGATSQTIRVYKINIVVGGATNIYFKDTSPATLSTTYILTANGSSLGDFADGEPLWVAASGKPFQVNNSNAVALNYEIWYTQS